MHKSESSSNRGFVDAVKAALIWCFQPWTCTSVNIMADDLAVHNCSCSVRGGPVCTNVPVRCGYRGIRQILGSLQSYVLPSVATVFVTRRGPAGQPYLETLDKSVGSTQIV
jgi:hypothetical protein